MEVTKGVNLGGWLVLERWIAPSLFEGTSAKDEYSLASELGSDEFKRRIRHHRKTFITEKHVSQLAERGVEFVRVPIGYWLFEDQDGFTAATDYVDALFGWAETYGMKILLDLHAPEGSQNGHDHSGRAGSIVWEKEPVAASARALVFLEKVCRRYGDYPELVGIEVLNEPGWNIPLTDLMGYYVAAHETIRTVCHSGVRVIVSDSFRPTEVAPLVAALGLEHIVLDVHLYQLFTPEDRALDLNGHTEKADQEWLRTLRDVSKHMPILVGEWSAAMSELYDTGVGNSQRTYQAHDYAQYYAAQRSTFERVGVAWAYWTARTEDGGVWSWLDHPHFDA